MSEKPKRRWYQFSLRTLLVAMALVGIVLGVFLPWRAHRRFCLDRAQYHESELASLSDHDVDIEFVSGLLGDKEDELLEKFVEQIKADSERAEIESRSHRTLAAAYQHAVWRPWEIYWIDDPHPFPAPNRFHADSEAARRFLSAMSQPNDPEKQQALDALRRKLADESREKYGVP